MTTLIILLFLAIGIFIGWKYEAIVNDIIESIKSKL